ncbi:RimJ/RimL family protein N-acetyltransferase [Luteibacter rhizovicinus]|uniref:RimJ/RimL family protein N-acetyltransferase n=1 Tax=Luteibacter rhizovicinus TaxID=242606 RepID=A0A4V2W3T6_9GAMM|nr:GNAT family N-acetyltransferase [Luteibacter rhizovicinus]TCV93319.1 RimJ/RimL family protein N-acetyltransferase [Luteibacter rhizovicinus]
MDTTTPPAGVLPYPRDLTGDGISLRPYRQADADALAAAVRESVDTVGYWQDWCHADYGLETARAWIEHCLEGWFVGDHYAFLIVDATTDEFLGGMGINQINREHRFANLGYWVRQSRQGQRIATRAGRLATRFAFDSVKVTRLEIVAAAANVPSRRTAESIGACFEGIERHRLVLRGVAMDAAMYSLIPSDLG